MDLKTKVYGHLFCLDQQLQSQILIKLCIFVPSQVVRVFD